MAVVAGAALGCLQETTTIFVLSFIFCILGIGFLCWLLFTLAVYALPCFVGATAAIAAFRTGAGVVGAIPVGFVAAVVTFVVGQVAFAAIRSPLIRAVIAITFATPAAIAGYHAMRGLARIGVPSPVWQEIFAIVGAACVGGTALVRIAGLMEPAVPHAPASADAAEPPPGAITG
jgi:hypothetical protein